MTRIIRCLAIFFSTVLVWIAPSFAQPAPPCPNIPANAAAERTFRVTFDGIVVHDMETHRAMLVQGGAFTKRHAQWLVIPTAKKENAAVAQGIDIPTLRDAANARVMCNEKDCRVALDGLSIRIGTSNTKDRQSLPATVCDSFDALTPHLSRITKSEMRPLHLSPMPEPPVAAYVELTDGFLTACKFAIKARFVPDRDNEGIRPFADLVFLDGVLEARAELQIKSDATLGEWVIVPRTSNEMLKICIENHPTTPTRDYTHFALNGKLLRSEKAPAVCPEAVVGGDVIDEKACAESHTISPIPPRDPLKASPSICRDEDRCTTPARSESHLGMVAGCANTQYP